MFVLDWLKQLLQAHVLIPYGTYTIVWYDDGNGWLVRTKLFYSQPLNDDFLQSFCIQQNAALTQNCQNGMVWCQLATYLRNCCRTGH
jgi:hypothetical protein